MIGKLLANLLGNSDEEGTNNTRDFVDENENFEDLFEFDDGEWVIINIREPHSLALPTVDPLENLLIEHPSMSVYQLRRGLADEEDLGYQQEEARSLRSLSVQFHGPWRTAAWASVLLDGSHLCPFPRARAYLERRTLTRGALHRQSMARARFSSADRSIGHFKQPRQRLYNY